MHYMDLTEKFVIDFYLTREEIIVVEVEMQWGNTIFCCNSNAVFQIFGLYLLLEDSKVSKAVEVKP